MLYLLAMEIEGTVGDDARWVQRRVIDLKTLLRVGNPKRQPCLGGVAQDANVIFVRWRLHHRSRVVIAGDEGVRDGRSRRLDISLRELLH